MGLFKKIERQRLFDGTTTLTFHYDSSMIDYADKLAFRDGTRYAIELIAQKYVDEHYDVLVKDVDVESIVKQLTLFIAVDAAKRIKDA